MSTVDLGFYIAGGIVGAAALLGYLAQPIAAWLARGDADLDRLVSEALDRPDYQANIDARWQG